MKRVLYVGSFTILGVLLSFIVHAGLEWPLLYLITHHYERYSTSFWWQHWSLLHGVGSIILLIGGVVVGFWQGRRWWQIMYVEDRYHRTRV